MILSPFVVSLSNHEAGRESPWSRSPFDKLRVNGF